MDGARSEAEHEVEHEGEPVEKLTLRDAAERTGLSITTLRRYIRSGKLIAGKSPGRYGPEYIISPDCLEQAGIKTGERATDGGRAKEPDGAPPAGALNVRGPHAEPVKPSTAGAFVPENLLREMIPIDLYRELSMKHEQLLVQYGMVRVGGQRLMEFKAQAEQVADTLRRTEEAALVERERYERDAGFLKKHLRQAELEIEEKNQEIFELREKLKILELISRNAITTESIEQQFLQVFDKRRQLEELTATSSDERRRKLAALDELLRSGFRVPPPEPTDQ